MERTLEIENLGQRSGVIDASITNRIQEIEERIAGAGDATEKNIGTTVKENAKRFARLQTQSFWLCFFGLGKFSSIILLKIFTGPLTWESFLSSVPINLRFGQLILSWISWMF